jgi:hypothetical protein
MPPGGDMTLKESLESAQAEVTSLKAEAVKNTETTSGLTKQLEQLTAALKKMDDESKSKKAKKSDNKDGDDEDNKDGDDEDNKDGGDDEDQEDDGKDDKKSKSKKAKAETDIRVGLKVVDVTELKTRCDNAERDARNANARISQLEGEAKTIDTAAEIKAREIAARNGGNLPAKAHEHGNAETEKSVATGSWRERLTSFWKI